MHLIYSRSKRHKRKDTGYSTASSQNLYSTKMVDERSNRHKDKKSDKKPKKRNRSNSSVESDIVEVKKSKRGDAGGGKKLDKKDKKKLVDRKVRRWAHVRQLKMCFFVFCSFCRRQKIEKSRTRSGGNNQ